MRKTSWWIVVFLMLCSNVSFAQADTAAMLFDSLRSRLEGIHDYVADVKVKIDVAFMKIPLLKGKMYFKAPDKMKLERNGGISILPKKNNSLTLNTMLPTGEVTVIDAGDDVLNGKQVKVIKVIPDSDDGGIILTKIWVDAERNLALRTETTTRDNGTVKMDLAFGKYADKGLPDKVTVHLDVKEYKLPKGVTMDYDASQVPHDAAQNEGKNKKGTIEIYYINYKVNEGVPDDIFKEKL